MWGTFFLFRPSANSDENEKHWMCFKKFAGKEDHRQNYGGTENSRWKFEIWCLRCKKQTLRKKIRENWEIIRKSL